LQLAKTSIPSQQIITQIKKTDRETRKSNTIKSSLIISNTFFSDDRDEISNS